MFSRILTFLMDSIVGPTFVMSIRHSFWQMPNPKNLLDCTIFDIHIQSRISYNQLKLHPLNYCASTTKHTRQWPYRGPIAFNDNGTNKKSGTVVISRIVPARRRCKSKNKCVNTDREQIGYVPASAERKNRDLHSVIRVYLTHDVINR